MLITTGLRRKIYQKKSALKLYLKEQIKIIFEKSKGIYGSHRI
ncbi:MAG: hypothetical protein ACI94Y_000696 [Maribacter sp.]|jgi:hypothetical protein